MKYGLYELRNSLKELQDEREVALSDSDMVKASPQWKEYLKELEEDIVSVEQQIAEYENSGACK